MRIPVLPILAIITAQAYGVDAQSLRGLTATTTTQTAEPASICGSKIPQPASLPPTSLSPVVYQIAPCFGRGSKGDPELYLADIQLKPSQASLHRWVRYDGSSEKTILEDFQRLWQNHALVSLSVEIQDYRFSNGVIGKLVTYTMAEREP